MTDNLLITAVKVLKDKVMLEYVDTINSRPYITEEKSTPHPDLVNSLKPLDTYLARIHYLPEEHLDKISSNGFSTKAESGIIVIKGMLTVPTGRKVAINSDAIDITKEVYGFESELEEIITKIQDEAFKFFFQDKTAQQKIDFDDKDKESGESLTQGQRNDDIGKNLDGKAAGAGEDVQERELESLPEETKELEGSDMTEPTMGDPITDSVEQASSKAEQEIANKEENPDGVAGL